SSRRKKCCSGSSDTIYGVLKGTRMSFSRTLRMAVCAALLLASAATARTIGQGNIVSQEIPPPRLATLPSFHVPRAGSRDESWEFLQVLYDVDTTASGWTSFLNAVPVAFEFTHQGRGFITTLHTVFHSTDGGRAWRNLDAFPPPPLDRTSPYQIFRSPVYIGDAATRPVLRTAPAQDTLFLAIYDTDENVGRLRVIYYLGSLVISPTTVVSVDRWLTGALFTDSTHAFTLAGLEGHIYYNDSLRSSPEWEDLNPDKVILRTGRGDSLDFDDCWIGDIATAQNLVVAVGSHLWISRDRGEWWRIVPASDSQFDNAVSFCDSLHGITGGGRITPALHGWVHVTDDGAHTWSARTLNTLLPIRAVLRVTPEIAFAAGGHYELATGAVWRSANGGQTWDIALSVDAEITELAANRVNSAYVDVFAAGYFPDFRGGVWRTRLYLPDTTDAVVIADPDTLDFGMVPPARNDTLAAVLRNVGSQSDTIVSVSGSGPFSVLWNDADSTAIAPGEELAFSVIFRSDTAGEFSRRVTVTSLRSGTLDLPCFASIGLDASGREDAPLPASPTLTVWPNPSNSVFQIRYDLPAPARVTLSVFDINGRLVELLVGDARASGQHILSWDASRCATGLYFVRLETDGRAIRTQKLLLLR
ncbi:MAG: T9SS type A sorting domain-containing protein, partial [bacterium]|nr:T9SS type A sorting domain-containing protein [bacterium]